MTLAELGLITLVTCPYVQEEVQRNLTLKLPGAVPYFERLRESIPWEALDDPAPDEVDLWLEVIEPKDAPILAAAVAAAPDRFVTLDKAHFLESSQVAERSRLIICTPGELIREIRRLLSGLTGGEV